MKHPAKQLWNEDKRLRLSSFYVIYTPLWKFLALNDFRYEHVWIVFQTLTVANYVNNALTIASDIKFKNH